jgi:hypothetical protein
VSWESSKLGGQMCWDLRCFDLGSSFMATQHAAVSSPPWPGAIVVAQGEVNTRMGIDLA